MVDQFHHGPCCCANSAPDLINNASRQSVAIRAGFIMLPGWVSEKLRIPRIHEIKKFLIIAESSCGRTWQWYTVFPFQVLNLVRIVMLEKGGNQIVSWMRWYLGSDGNPITSKEFT